MPVMALLLMVCAGAEIEPALVKAEQQLRALDYRGAAEAFEPMCANGPCTRAQHLRAAYGLATALASQGQGTKASTAFRTLLFVDPDWRLPPGASPRVREPFEQAQAYMRLQPRAAVTVRGALTQGTAGRITGVLSGDPLGLVGRLVLVVESADGAKVVSPAGRQPTGDGGGFSETFEVDESLIAVASHFTVQARTRSEGVVLESARQPIAAKAGELSTTTPLPSEPRRRALLQLDVAALFDALNLQLGVEVRAGVAVASFLELSAGALLGQQTGLRVQALLHFPRADRLHPFVAARFGLHPLSNGVAVGGGLLLGATIEAGPGRIVAALAGEAFAAPSSFSPWVVGPMAGYQLDVPGLTAQ